MASSTDRTNQHQSEAQFSRRELLLGAAGVAAVGTRSGRAQTQKQVPTPSPPQADHVIRIAPLTLEIAPGKVIQHHGL